MARVPYGKISAEGFKHLLDLNQYLAKLPGSELLDLVYLRVSQINGCSYCVDLHWQDAKKKGVDLRKINSVVTWKKTTFFTEIERAALLLAEELTELNSREISDELYEKIAPHFSEKELVDLTLAIANMNAMNRMAIMFKQIPA